jgi:hypothetical protein
LWLADDIPRLLFESCADAAAWFVRRANLPRLVAESDIPEPILRRLVTGGAYPMSLARFDRLCRALRLVLVPMREADEFPPMTDVTADDAERYGLILPGVVDDE